MVLAPHCKSSFFFFYIPIVYPFMSFKHHTFNLNIMVIKLWTNPNTETVIQMILDEQDGG